VAKTRPDVAYIDKHTHARCHHKGLSCR
jgi:hypothetical protein